MTFDSGSRRAGMYIYADTSSSSGPGYAYQIWQRENDLGIWEVTSGSHTRQAYANLSASNGQTYSYKASYDPATGVITVWRNNVYAVSWTAGTPRTSGNQLILRTTDSQARFDDIKVNGTTLTYLHSDHLGSNSLMSKQNGTSVVDSQTYYLPFGDYRGPAPSQTLTNRDYTGHKENMELGLIYMNARYYLPGLARFISADSLVPDPTNPQSYNRYSYVYNNPLGFTDPSGHTGCSAGNRCVGNNGPISMPSSSATSSPMTVNVADEYSDWYAGVYSGCFMCHAGKETNLTVLTNDQLAYVYNKMIEDSAPHAAVVGTGFVVMGALALPELMTTVSGAACADGDCINELSTLQQQASNLRATGTPDGTIGAGRNIATANFNIGGVSGNLQAVSGTANRLGTVSNPTIRFFTTYSGREFDSEVKIFEYLAQSLQNNPNASGMVVLYSERAICSSCVGVLNQFMEMFPM